MYLIGQLAKQTNLPLSTIRYYEKRGLLTSVRQNAENGYHYYDNNTIVTIVWITGLKEIGFTLNEIKAFLSEPASDRLAQMLAIKQIELLREIEVAQNKLKLLSEYLRKEGNENGMEPFD